MKKILLDIWEKFKINIKLIISESFAFAGIALGMFQL